VDEAQDGEACLAPADLQHAHPVDQAAVRLALVPRHEARAVASGGEPAGHEAGLVLDAADVALGSPGQGAPREVGDQAGIDAGVRHR
jgi:hypothetical protein